MGCPKGKHPAPESLESSLQTKLGFFSKYLKVSPGLTQLPGALGILLPGLRAGHRLVPMGGDGQDRMDSMRTLRSRAGRRWNAVATVFRGAEDVAGG